MFYIGRDYSLRGAYRHVVVCPKDLTWQVMTYNDPHRPLVLSDIEILRGEKLVVENEGKFCGFWKIVHWL